MNTLLEKTNIAEIKPKHVNINHPDFFFEEAKRVISLSIHPNSPTIKIDKERQE